MTRVPDDILSTAQSAYHSGMRLGVSEDSFESNFYQCMALAAGVAGELSSAESLLSYALSAVSTDNGMPFSCWSFVDVTKEQFADHCGKIREYIFANGRPPEVVASYRHHIA